MAIFHMLLKWAGTIVLLITNLALEGQNKTFKYYNPAKDPAIVVQGQAWPDEVQSYYDRLPLRAREAVRKPVWELSKNSAGLQIKFITDAPEIIVRYQVFGNRQMPHMPATGVSGIDLYAKGTNGEWLWAAGNYTFGDTIVYKFTNITPEKREYVLYLPLYSSVNWMDIGVPNTNEFTPIPASMNKPVVVYGTSIAQGGCASRPGLAWTNIVSRYFVDPFINLSFSGNGRLEPALLSLISEIDARLYVLDCLPNMTMGYMPTDTLKKRIAYAATFLKSKRPYTPILFTEHDGFAGADLNHARLREYTEANKALGEVLDSLKKAGFTNIYLLKKEAIRQGIETTVDGTHPNDIGMMYYAEAYTSIIKTIFSENKSNRYTIPALIPLPQQLSWKEGFFDLFSCKSIAATNKDVAGVAGFLQKKLNNTGLSIPVVSTINTKNRQIELVLNRKDKSLQPEAYHLNISVDKVSIQAASTHGIFNGIQTFLQLIQNPKKVPACEIFDYPAFSWRGYMVDVGRNFMSMELLKQQIDEMARYKLNVFHFHPTEDIAWRFAIKAYPQLTADSTMLRDKGKYYSQQDIHELIQYCKERRIIFVPEIDMPGHSAAFRRAMGVDMQSSEGLKIVKNILKEICTTYDVPYIHIGADEVKITNQQFIPEVTKYIESFGKKVIGWQPGGNFTQNTIRQLWMEDKSHLTPNNHLKFIDSRHLYLNHMDPLEAVTTIFDREIGDVAREDSNMLGGTLCVWNDRRVNTGMDILKMNPVYPGMLAFAERCWKGGGQKQWIANISDGDIQGFQDFENRLLIHKKEYFSFLPFPYVKQTQMHWNLFGPFDNKNQMTMQFVPELFPDSIQLLNIYKKEIGGTIVLRHWWYPLIKGAIDRPEENTTWYAYTRLWSNIEGNFNFWIGFYNISRSQATNSPPENGWDYKGSKLWVNHTLVQPPQWNHPGMKGDLEIPLTDEGYEYRPPSTIRLKKGWNDVLIKNPVGSFQGINWNNPVKWMFTFVPLESLN